VTEALKHLADVFSYPLVVSLALAVIAAILRLLGRRFAAAWLLGFALVVGYGGAVPRFGDLLLAPLESEYPPLASDGPLPQIAYIVVLGSSYVPRDGIPVTAALDPEGLARVVEGVRLERRLPQARLVLSGGAPAGRVPGALGYAKLARELGVADSSLILLDSPTDTAQEASDVARRLAGARFLLVTSASQMPRAMKLMRINGARPIAAPTAQHREVPSSRWGGWLPTAGGLRKSELAIHEYLGLVAVALGIG
jgi:uncharacterized SAM-binding protein YcdF (DUF218 family)